MVTGLPEAVHSCTTTSAAAVTVSSDSKTPHHTPTTEHRFWREIEKQKTDNTNPSQMNVDDFFIIF